MNTLNIENKEYVVISRKEYEDLRTKAAALFIESEGMPQTAKKFVDDAFAFFSTLSDERFIHRPCSRPAWKALNLRCVNFRSRPRTYSARKLFTGLITAARTA